MPQATKPYFKDGTKGHILILGDSMMYGAGVKDANYTIGALFGSKFPQASVETYAQNGAKVKDVHAQLKKAKHKKYKIIAIGVGGNDVIRFSRFSRLEKSLASLLKSAAPLADKLVIFHSANLGNISFFPFPLNRIYDRRSERISRVYKRVTGSFSNVVYVNFYRPADQDFYDKKTIIKFLADDSFHANEYANQFFFDLIWETLAYER